MNKFVSSFAALALVMVPAGLAAQDTDWNRYSLEKLAGVYVQIESDPTCEGAGVMASSFEASTSLILIEGEVGVLTQAEMLANPAHPELRVSLQCTGGSGGAMAYLVDLRVQQAAQLLRDTQITHPEAVTWFSTRLGMTDAGRAVDALGTALEEALDQFVGAWAAVNAEEGEPG